MIYSYSRVSTNKQICDRQTEALNEYAKANNFEYKARFEDTVSGKNFNRPQYELMKSALQKGDTLIIKEIDRLGRNWDMTAIEWKYYLDSGIKIVVLDTPILNTDTGNLTLDMRLVKEQIFTLMLYLAQKEREKISQRTKEALAVKKLQGKILGRPISEKPTDEIINAYKSGESYNSLCTTYALSKGTISKIINEAANNGLCETRRAVNV